MQTSSGKSLWVSEKGIITPQVRGRDKTPRAARPKVGSKVGSRIGCPSPSL